MAALPKHARILRAEVEDRLLHLSARGVFVEVNGATGSFHEFRTPVTPGDLVPKKAPARAEHTAAILRESGFSDAEIAALRGARVVE